jgi:hypothetical protein
LQRKLLSEEGRIRCLGYWNSESHADNNSPGLLAVVLLSVSLECTYLRLDFEVH